MRSSTTVVITGLVVIVVGGCYSTPRTAEFPASPRAAPPPRQVVQANHSEAKAPAQGSGQTPDPAKAQPLGLPDVVRLALERNPRLAQVTWAIEAARGRAIQAGLYPNPTVSVTGDELGDRAGPGGIWTAPMVSQEIVTGNKLGLSQAAAIKEVDRAALDVIAERYRVLTEVRQAFFAVAVLQARVDTLADLVTLAEQSVQTTERLLKAERATRLDVVQLEADRDRYRAELEATQRSLPAAYRRLVACVGVSDLPASQLVADLDTLPPDYDLDRLRAYVVGIHPELRSAQVGVERAQFLVRRAEVEPIPNLTLSTGFTRQNQNKSNDWNIGVSAPVPLWNKNQGNVLAAKAQLGEAVANVGRVQNDLLNRLAVSFGSYAAARKRSERYRSDVLPKTRETYDLSLKAYKGGQFEYLRVVQAQRTAAEANLEYLRSLDEMWRAASEVAGLMLEDQWPQQPAAPPPEKKQP